MGKLTLTNVSKTYRDARFAALNAISLEIPDREFAVLAGRPGCGKSTLFRVVAGLEEPSSGDILIDERRVNDLPPKSRDLAAVFGNSSLYPQLTAYDNIAVGLKLRNFATSEIGKRVKEAAEALRIEDLLNHKAATLSRTQQQRVALARAIARQPKLLLLDDPFANLSALSRAELRRELASLHRRLQTTIVYATGDPIEAWMLADKIVVLEKGTLVQTDLPRTVYDQPVNLFVAEFFGQPPMNLVRGELLKEGGSLFFCESSEGTIKVRLSVAAQSGAGEFVGKAVMLGIRPAEIEVAEAAKWDDDSVASFAAIVELVEPMGAETNLYLQTGAHRVICRSQRSLDRQEGGHRMQFKLNSRAVQLFDPTSTKRLSKPRSPA